MASGNPMLGFAAIILGTVCALERRASGGVLAPVLTHFVWGLIMVLALPPLFGALTGRAASRASARSAAVRKGRNTNQYNRPGRPLGTKIARCV